MAHDLIISSAARSTAMDAVTAMLNAGGAGRIEIFSGIKPAGPGSAITSQVLLATLTYSATSYAPSVAGVATANAITPGTAVASGTASWARHSSGAGAAILDETVGTSDTDIILETTTITVGVLVSLASHTLTHPA